MSQPSEPGQRPADRRQPPAQREVKRPPPPPAPEPDAFLEPLLEPELLEPESSVLPPASQPKAAPKPAARPQPAGKPPAAAARPQPAPGKAAQPQAPAASPTPSQPPAQPLAQPAPVQARQAATTHGMTGRPLPEDYLDEWAGRLAIAKKEHERGLVSAIVFRIGEELLALRASIFLEVSTELMPHRIPHRAQGAIAGLVNVRGELLPYVSMSLLLSLSADAHSGEREGGFSRRVAVVQKDGKWAFPVSAMQGIQRVNEATLKEPPATVGKALRKFTRGLFDSPDGPVALLDEELLFYTLKVEIA